MMKVVITLAHNSSQYQMLSLIFHVVSVCSVNLTIAFDDFCIVVPIILALQNTGHFHMFYYVHQFNWFHKVLMSWHTRDPRRPYYWEVF